MSVATADGATAARPRRPNASPRLRAAGDWARRAPLLPALLFLIVVTQLPFAATLAISFIRWNALFPDDRGFAGFGNYTAVLSDPTLRASVLNTVYLTVAVVLISVVLGMVAALLLDRSFRGRGVLRTLMIAPFLVVPVAAALVWKHALFNPEYGLFNGTLNAVWRLFGSSNAPQVDWISSYPRAAVDAALIWQWTPFMMLILLAGLQSRSGEAAEAARVDGASAWKAFWFITLPHMRQYLELGGLLGSIYIVQNFDAVYTMTSGGLGTANLPYSIYQLFFTANDYGKAAAAGVIVVIGSILIATFALRTVSSLFRQENAR